MSVSRDTAALAALAMCLCCGAVIAAGPEAPPVESFKVDLPALLEADRRKRFDELERELSVKGWYASIADQVCRPESLILESDRTPVDIVLRRTRALIAHLGKRHPGLDFAEETARLADIADRAGKLDLRWTQTEEKNLWSDTKWPRHARRGKGKDVFGVARLVDRDAAFALFVEADRICRRVMLSNPALDFRDILLCKQIRNQRVWHMVSQYYGSAAIVGGGLRILRGAFSDAPRLEDPLAESVVRSGPMKGRKLEGGAYLEPELTWDGRAVLFSWVREGTRGGGSHRRPRPRSDSAAGNWEPGRAYHIFRANLDGTGLVQLTDGGHNDLHPCPLPDGRVAFVSERRGGYARCARWHVLSYTLHSMATDGSDIRPLSYHETNEWHPAVTHEGMIIYTRWDYVDRGDCVAHHPWITTPDGCDPRAVHGNYPPAEGSARPNMEMHIRPIPGSSRYVAVAAPHHGYSTGSLVRLDFARPDDDQVSQVRRITPMVPFPEVAYRPLPDAHFYAPGYDAAWPITEDLYLSSYKYEAQNEPFNRLGVCLVDTFGNRTLVYADEQFDCVTPQPIRARPVPPVLPRRTGADPQAAADGEGVVTCVDEAILDGQEPDGLPRRSGAKTGLSLRSLRRDLPLEWDEQRRSLAE